MRLRRSHYLAAAILTGLPALLVLLSHVLRPDLDFGGPFSTLMLGVTAVLSLLLGATLLGGWKLVVRFVSPGRRWVRGALQVAIGVAGLVVLGAPAAYAGLMGPVMTALANGLPKDTAPRPLVQVYQPAPALELPPYFPPAGGRGSRASTPTLPPSKD